ncbi:hypothetical protein C8Q79DRAFT_1013653 [Trametes meyenii]|nr:hypothetical protein C8Q79DRAFT_1013653 [Trametes meyenii]
MPSTAVKRERSPSPALVDTGPRLITDGCVRFAPLPPECRNGRPGYKAARQNWIAREVQKLHARGLRPTRTFVRDDGLVIDWKSKVPVMSDTLRPPTTTDDPKGISDSTSGPVYPAKKAKAQHDSATGNSSTEKDPRHSLQTVLTELRDDAPYFPHARPASPHEVIPAPGETIWRRISPPPRNSLFTTDAEQMQSQRRIEASEPHPQTILLSKPTAAPSGTAPGGAIDYSSNVDIIDLIKVEDPDLVFDDALPTVETSVLPSHAPPIPPPSLDTEAPRPPLPRRRRPSAPKGTPLPRVSSIPSENSGLFAEHSSTQAVAQVPSTPNYSKPPLHIEVDTVQASALEFLRRFLTTFAEDRSALAGAYSRVATFSFTCPAPNTVSDAVCSPAAHHCGRFGVVSALLDLPEDETLGGTAQEVNWDFLYAREAGDVLLICYPSAEPPPRDKGEEKKKVQGKGKGKASAEADSAVLCCEQRFVLRPRDWDKEDRDTPGIWPLVAVSHQMMFRRL